MKTFKIFNDVYHRNNELVNEHFSNTNYKYVWSLALSEDKHNLMMVTFGKHEMDACPI